MEQVSEKQGKSGSDLQKTTQKNPFSERQALSAFALVPIKYTQTHHAKLTSEDKAKQQNNAKMALKSTWFSCQYKLKDVRIVGESEKKAAFGVFIRNTKGLNTHPKKP